MKLKIRNVKYVGEFTCAAIDESDLDLLCFILHDDGLCDVFAAGDDTILVRDGAKLFGFLDNEEELNKRIEKMED